MRRVAAPLAAALAAAAFIGCGEDGAEPGAPEDGAARDATLVLDFQPNAAHTGIYAAKANGHFEDEGVSLEIREPSSTADGAKLLEAGRVDFAVMDINDFGIARDEGVDLTAIAAIVQRPLAAVIATDPQRVKSPRDLEGAMVGVTGVPSDDAVLDTILSSDGADPEAVKRVSIGFNAVQALGSGSIDAATAFWSAEGVQLKQLGIMTREFRVDQFGAPRYPELVLVAGAKILSDPSGEGAELACAMFRGLTGGYDELEGDPASALDGLISEVPDLDRSAQQAQLAELVAGSAFSTGPKRAPSPELVPTALAQWSLWAEDRGLIRGTGPLAPSFGCE